MRYSRNILNTPALAPVNAELEKIEQAINDTLSRKGDAPNQLESTLDANSQRLINLPAPTSSTEPLRAGDVVNALPGTQRNKFLSCVSTEE